LEAGYRPAKVVPATTKELEELLTDSTVFSAIRSGEEKNIVCQKLLIEKLILAIKSYDYQTMDQVYYDEWYRKGPLNFVRHFISPLIDQLGRSWELGELSVSQEHFASEGLNDFLGSMWRQVQQTSTKKQGNCVLTTLPGEDHGLGLQMAGVITAITGRENIFLGTNTPYEEII
jgi:MerR family transcriptional regulator, light-induced transcriptional regulator